MINKEQAKNIAYILISVMISIIAIKLFIWLLPIVLMAILAIFLYNAIRRHNKSRVNKKERKDKKIIIIDSEDN